MGEGGGVNIERNNFFLDICKVISRRLSNTVLYDEMSLMFIVEVAKFEGLDPSSNPLDEFAPCGVWGELGESRRFCHLYE